MLAILHTWIFQNTILIREGVPVLDLLNGSATGSAGGQPRHQVQARTGVSKAGLGARDRQLAKRHDSSRDPTGTTISLRDLSFSSLATLNLRLFADLGQRPSVICDMPWLRGMRISLAIDNIANAQIHVQNRSGQVPINYQRYLIDSLGRTLTFSMRKLFF